MLQHAWNNLRLSALLKGITACVRGGARTCSSLVLSLAPCMESSLFMANVLAHCSSPMSFCHPSDRKRATNCTAGKYITNAFHRMWRLHKKYLVFVCMQGEWGWGGGMGGYLGMDVCFFLHIYQQHTISKIICPDIVWRKKTAS